MYLVFAYETYYPHGGFHDFKGACPTLEAAIELAKTFKYMKFEQSNDGKIYGGWWHIVDTATHEVVKHREYDDHLYEEDVDVEFVVVTDDWDIDCY